MPMPIYTPHLDDSSSISGNCSREIRLISHSAEHFPWSALLYFIDWRVYQSSTQSARVWLLNFLGISPLRPVFFSCLHRYWLKLKVQTVITESGRAFIYCTDDHCFKIDLYHFWWPERTPSLSRVNKQLYVLSFLCGKSANITRYL